MPIKSVATAVEKALTSKLDEATSSRIVERVVKDAASGDKDALSQLVQLLRAARTEMAW